MILKPNHQFIFFLVFFALFMIMVTWIIYASSQKSALETWETFYSRYVVEKNRHLNTSFFQNTSNLSQFQNLNYNYFKRLLDEDISFHDIDLAGIAIYNVHEQFIWSHRLNPYTVSNSIKDIDVFDLVKDKLVLNDVSIVHAKYQNSNYRLIVAPLRSSNFIHNVSIVYIFNIDSLMRGSDSFRRLTMTSYLIFLVFFGIIYSLRSVCIKYIKVLVKYIDSNSIGKQKTLPHYLNHIKPFDVLAKKISQLIALVKEHETRYIEVCQKFFDFAALSSEGWVTIDKSGLIVFCNKRFTDILKYEDEDELYNTRFVSLLFDEKEIQKYSEKSETIHLKNPIVKKLCFITKNGDKKECKLKESHILGNDDSIIGYCFTISEDINVYSDNVEKAELAQYRSIHFEQEEQALVILDSERKIIDVNYAFLNYVHQERSTLISKPFTEIVKEFEVGKSWQENVRGFEIFEPSLKKWYYISQKELKFEETSCSLICFLDMEMLRKEYYYSKLILEDMKGFYFITNKENQVLYLSPSFTKITENSEAWFKNYYALMLLSKDESTDIHESMVITYRKNRFEFTVNPLFTSIDTINLYQALLK